MKQRILSLYSQKKRIFKYLLVGGIAFIADYSGFIILYNLLKLPLYLANTTALILGLIISFGGNKVWVFRNTEAHRTNKGLNKQFIYYVMLFAFNTFISYFVIKSLSYLGLSSNLAKLVSMLVIISWNYLIYSKYIFKHNELPAKSD